MLLLVITAVLPSVNIAYAQADWPFLSSAWLKVGWLGYSGVALGQQPVKKRSFENLYFSDAKHK